MPQTPNRRRSRRTIVKSRRRKRRTRVRTRKSDDQLDFEEGAFSPFNRRRQIMYIGSKKKRKKKSKGKKKKGGMEAGAEPEPAAEEEAPAPSSAPGQELAEIDAILEAGATDGTAQESDQVDSLTRADRLLKMMERRAAAPPAQRTWLLYPLNSVHLDEIGIFLRAYEDSKEKIWLCEAVKYLAKLFPYAPDEVVDLRARVHPASSITHVLQAIKIRDEFSAARIKFYMRVQRWMVRNGKLREEQIRWLFIFLILLCMVPMYISPSYEVEMEKMTFNREYKAIMQFILNEGREEVKSAVSGNPYHDLETLRLNWVPRDVGGRTTDALWRYVVAATPQEIDELRDIGILGPPTEAEPEPEAQPQIGFEE